MFNNRPRMPYMGERGSYRGHPRPQWDDSGPPRFAAPHNGSDSFTRKKKKSPAELMARIQQRLQSENFFDMYEGGRPGEEHSSPSSGRGGRGRPPYSDSYQSYREEQNMHERPQRETGHRGHYRNQQNDNGKRHLPSRASPPYKRNRGPEHIPRLVDIDIPKSFFKDDDFSKQTAKETDKSKNVSSAPTRDQSPAMSGAGDRKRNTESLGITSKPAVKSQKPMKSKINVAVTSLPPSSIEKESVREETHKNEIKNVPAKSDLKDKSDKSAAVDTEVSNILFQCIVCKINKFSDIATFDKHLQSQHHSHMVQLQTGRNDNLEQFKRAGAKLATRAMEYELEQHEQTTNKVTKSDSNFTRCSYCHCTVLNQLITNHNQLLQHKELVEFVRPLCCGIKFINRQSYETHRTTKKHIAAKWDFERKFIVKVILDSEKGASKGSKNISIKNSKLSNPLTLPMPTYLSNVIQKMGSEPFIKDDKVDYCLACEVSVPDFRRTFHPKSSDHHENVMSYTADFKVRMVSHVNLVLTELTAHLVKPAAPVVEDIDQFMESYGLETEECDPKQSDQPPDADSTIADTEDFEYDFDMFPQSTENSDPVDKSKPSETSNFANNTTKVIEVQKNISRETTNLAQSTSPGESPVANARSEFGSKIEVTGNKSVDSPSKYDNYNKEKKPIDDSSSKQHIVNSASMESEDEDDDEDFDYEFGDIEEATEDESKIVEMPVNERTDNYKLQKDEDVNKVKLSDKSDSEEGEEPFVYDFEGTVSKVDKGVENNMDADEATSNDDEEFAYDLEGVTISQSTFEKNTSEIECGVAVQNEKISVSLNKDKIDPKPANDTEEESVSQVSNYNASTTRLSENISNAKQLEEETNECDDEDDDFLYDLPGVADVPEQVDSVVIPTQTKTATHEEKQQDRANVFDESEKCKENSQEEADDDNFEYDFETTATMDAVTSQISGQVLEEEDKEDNFDYDLPSDRAEADSAQELKMSPKQIEVQKDEMLSSTCIESEDNDNSAHLKTSERVENQGVDTDEEGISDEFEYDIQPELAMQADNDMKDVKKTINNKNDTVQRLGSLLEEDSSHDTSNSEFDGFTDNGSKSKMAIVDLEVIDDNGELEESDETAIVDIDIVVEDSDQSEVLSKPVTSDVIPASSGTKTDGMETLVARSATPTPPSRASRGSGQAKSKVAHDHVVIEEVSDDPPATPRTRLLKRCRGASASTVGAGKQDVDNLPSAKRKQNTRKVEEEENEPIEVLVEIVGKADLVEEVVKPLTSKKNVTPPTTPGRTRRVVAAKQVREEVCQENVSNKEKLEASEDEPTDVEAADGNAAPVARSSRRGRGGGIIRRGGKASATPTTTPARAKRRSVAPIRYE